MAAGIRHIEGAAVHTVGSGPGIVLLHANGGDSTDFAAIQPHLARSATVHAVDWPGWGCSGSEVPPTALGYAALLPTLLERLTGGPFVLLGNSVGGFAAIAAAARRPDLVRGLVLVNPGGFTRPSLTMSMTCRAIGSAYMAPAMMRLLPLLYLRRTTPAVQAIRANAVAMSRQPERVAAFASVWRSFAVEGHDATKLATRIVAPTLLVWGRRDPVLPWFLDGQRARRSLHGAQVVLFPCGHQAFAEMPEAFLAALEPFLASIPPGAIAPRDAAAPFAREAGSDPSNGRSPEATGAPS